MVSQESFLCKSCQLLPMDYPSDVVCACSSIIKLSRAQFCLRDYAQIPPIQEH
jgi:hypothetical protein